MQVCHERRVLVDRNLVMNTTAQKRLTYILGEDRPVKVRVRQKDCAERTVSETR